MNYNTDVINSIRDKMIDKNCTLAVAESVTSGHLQAAISTATQASLFYQGGITAYNAGQKTRHLDVEPIHATNHDCVAEKVAEQMALGVNRLFLSDYGIGVTGYATTVPENDVNELYAFFAIAQNQQVLLTKKINLPDQETLEAQVEYTQIILAELNQLLGE